MMIQHKEWYQVFKKTYLVAGEKKAIAAVIKEFGVKRRYVLDALAYEQWPQKIQAELENSEEAIAQYLKKINLHQKHHESIGFKSVRVATAQLDLHERVQNLLLSRFSAIESKSISPDRMEPYIALTVRIMGEASRSLHSTIAAVDKSRSIASEALQIEEMRIQYVQVDLPGLWENQ